jgi:predicted MFS family arabinose efflux permease
LSERFVIWQAAFFDCEQFSMSTSIVDATHMQSLSPARFAWLIFTPFGCAYVISYALRTVNAAIAPQLTAEFGLNASQLGLLTAAYFLAFSFTQLPLGGWLDRYRPRRVEAMLMLVCAAGCFVFASATSSAALIVGRALIGIGVAACLMATLRTFGLWLPAKKLPAMNGYMLAVGNAGAILSTAPVLWLLGFITWSQMFFAVGVLSVLVAIWLAFAVPDPERNAKASSVAPSSAPVASWRVVLRSPLFWAIAPITCFTNAMGLAMQGLWAGPWLVDVGGMHPREIGNYLLLISAGMFVANIALGTWMGRRVARGESALKFAALACVGALLALLPWLFSWIGSPALLLTLFGLTHVAGNLVFAALTPRFPPGVAGRLSTTLNFFMFGLGFALQWGIGVVVNQYPTSTPGRYAAAGYETAFAVVAAIEAAILLWTLFALPRALKGSKP